jgi:hypothetical protein
MSAAALGTVLVQLAVRGSAPEADEGAAAHIWQILMVGQLPLIAWSVARWFRSSWHRTWPVLATQIVAATCALLPVAVLGW